MNNNFSKIVIIGSSSGGPQVLQEIISHFSKNLNLLYIIVQHMPLNYNDFFLENLKKHTSLEIVSARDRIFLEKGKIFFIPPKSIIEFKESLTGKIFLRLYPYTEKEAKISQIDQAMTAGAQFFKEKTVGIILSGMGKDGLEGMKEVKKFGGYTIAQNPETARISSMPKTMTDHNLVDAIMEPDSIAQKIKALSLLSN